MKKKKELENLKREEELKQARIETHKVKQQTRLRKHEEFHYSGGSAAFVNPEDREIQPSHGYVPQDAPVKPEFKKPQQFAIDPNSMTDFGVNDRDEGTYMISELGTGFSGITINEPSVLEERKFSSYSSD